MSKGINENNINVLITTITLRYALLRDMNTLSLHACIQEFNVFVILHHKQHMIPTANHQLIMELGGGEVAGINSTFSY